MTSKTYLTFLLLATIGTGHAQKLTDTGALIKEFDNVMSFAVQPYLHYTSTTSFRSGSQLAGTDTGYALHNDFYKVGDDLYVGNEQEEMYLQDSLMVRINHPRKTIQVNRVDIATKKKMDVLPLKKGIMQKLFREHFTIADLPGEGDTGRIQIRSITGDPSQRARSMEMRLLYSRQLHLPLLMQVILSVPSQGGDQPVVSQEQILSVHFGQIMMTAETAAAMPSWKGKISYDDTTKMFSGKGPCEGYEVMKTF